MVSQFISPDPVRLLGDLDFDFPEGTHAIGRLDSNSEGLLLLTTDKRITRLLFQGQVPHKRTYLVQVKGEVLEDELERLRNGISISHRGAETFFTSPCEVIKIEQPETLLPGLITQNFPLPHPWLLMTLTEGKFHQVRKMVLAVGHKCKRLIRLSIEDLILTEFKPGEVREMSAEVFFKQLKLQTP